MLRMFTLVVVELTPAKIAEYVQNRDGALLSTACGSGREPLAEAFLKLWLSLLHCACSSLTILKKYTLTSIHH